jgi:hypothetical protein
MPQHLATPTSSTNLRNIILSASKVLSVDVPDKRLTTSQLPCAVLPGEGNDWPRALSELENEEKFDAVVGRTQLAISILKNGN